ncbi:MAG: CPBP family glutamic-type intramembrane protease, partial [Phycisphaerales bacterium]
WCEFAFLYVLVPPLVAGLMQPQMGDAVLRRVGIMNRTFEMGIPGGMILFPLLLLTFVSMFLFLRLDPTFESRKLWNWKGFRHELRRIALVFAVLGPLVLLAAWLVSRFTAVMPEDSFLRLPRENPGLMLAICLFYPWLSAYPQEITHRAFFFHRYRAIIGDGATAFVLNVIAFAWLHIVMWNWIAVVMTVPAGILFAWTYRRSDSALGAGFEHAIYGLWVFFTGLGYFVYTGNAGVG